MTFEATITIRRSDPQELTDEFRAVTQLLEQRKAERTAAKPAPLRLVPSRRLSR
jgi:hypothetical protein